VLSIVSVMASRRWLRDNRRQAAAIKRSNQLSIERNGCFAASLEMAAPPHNDGDGKFLPQSGQCAT
jgi:hypothetical protein